MAKKPQDLLTASERAAFDTSVQLARQLREIIGNGPNAYHDWVEASIHLHALQNMLLSQAASRAYPNEFRLLGEKLSPPTAEDLE